MLKNKKFLTALMMTMLLIPCTVMLTACGGVSAKTKDTAQRPTGANELTRQYTNTNFSSRTVYDEHFYTFYSYNPTYMSQLPFAGITMDFSTSKDKFYTSTWNGAHLVGGSGSVTFFDNNKSIRISYSFTVTQEDETHSRFSASLTYSVNNGVESFTRSVNQIVKHADNLVWNITHTNTSIKFGDTVLELVYDEMLGVTPMISELRATYTTHIDATGTFIDYTLKY